MTRARRPSRAWIAIGAALLVWLVFDRPWTVRPIGQQTSAPASFDAAAYVDAIWTTRVVPEIEANAVGVAFFRDAIATNPAGGQTGAIAVEGRVVSIDTSSRVGFVLVDADPADGQPDAAIQIGPVLRGTALRDALDFIAFTDFTNQIEFAAVAGALNDRVLADVLAGVDFSAIDGRGVRVVGAATLTGADALPSVVPTRVVVEDRP